MKRIASLTAGFIAVATSFTSCTDKDDFPSNPSFEEEKPTEVKKDTVDLKKAAGEAMTNVMKCFYGISPDHTFCDIYPYPEVEDQPEWHHISAVWGQTGPLGAFVAMRALTKGTNDEARYKQYEDDLFNGIQTFQARWPEDDSGTMGYCAYPGVWNDRYFDDNAWVGIVMADWYKVTGEQRFLDAANVVWNYINTRGWNPQCGGGILWREKNDPTVGTNTCSTGPTAVLSAKLYQITKDQKYLDFAIKCYDYVIDKLQDKNTHLFWDNIQPDGHITDWVFSYNAGTPMQAACLLYEITNDQKYLDEAKAIGQAALDRFYTLYRPGYVDGITNGSSMYLLTNGDFGFHGVLMRAYFELYKCDKDPKYIKIIKDNMAWLWQYCRDSKSGLLNDGSLIRNANQTQWDVRKQGFFVEMLARLALIEEGKDPNYSDD